MIRCLAAVLAIVLLSWSAFADDKLSDIEAIDNVVGRIDEAVQQHDAETIKELMTDDHVAVLPFHDGPQSLDQLIATLPDLKIKQTDLSEPTVVLLGPDSAMRTLTARLELSQAGEAFDSKVFITSIMAKKDGKWLESFYQVTTLAK